MVANRTLASAGYWPLGFVALCGLPLRGDDGFDNRFGAEAVLLAGGPTEVQRRLTRSPQDVAQQLSEFYGQHLDVVMYQPALALVARLRLGELTGDRAHRDDVERIVAPYVLGMGSPQGKPPNGSQLAGHLVFAALAELTLHPRYISLTQVAADHAFDDEGHLREAMPFHNEMSDAVFMGCPILTAAGRLTGDVRYVQMAGRHLQYMRSLCLREDGLYRHSPLCEAPWGRGNGFPALGLSLSLTDLDALSATEGVLPQNDRRADGSADARAPVRRLRAEMLQAFQSHMEALRGYQDSTGMWHQVIDVPESYPELTATCMITFALVRGIRQGWLESEQYQPVVERAWEAIKVRIGEDGRLFQVCTGTGKQQTLQDYLERPAINGRDERGGAMALMCAVELAIWLQERQHDPAASGTRQHPPRP